MKNLVGFLLITMFTLSATAVKAQEYDDLYFTKKDRKKVKTLAEDFDDNTETSTTTSSNTSFLGRQIEEYQNPSYSIPDNEINNTDPDTNGVSQAAINKYKRSNIDRGEAEEEVIQNPSYSVPAETYQDDRNVTINNYYADPRFRNPRPRWGFNSYWGTWGNGFAISYGRGAFGNPWYDPFYNFSYGPRYGWGSNAWGWNGFYDPFWCPAGVGFAGRPYIGRFNRAPVIVYSGESAARRNVVTGARSNRGGTASSSGRDRTLRNSAVSSTNESRDFNGKQAEYLERSSRNARISNSSNASSATSRSRQSSTQTRKSSVSRSSSSSRSRSSSNTSYRNSSSQRSYSTPSRQSTPTRKSSGSYRSSSPSRSSGYRSSSPSRSRSVSTPSRSSSGRSGSSSRSSSSSRSKRGN